MEAETIELNKENNNGSPKKSIKKNYFYSLLFQLFLVIVPLITTPYVDRVLKPSGVGQYSFSLSLITYFTIFASLGFGYYAQREIAKHDKDVYTQSKIFWEINICRLLPVAIALIVNIIFCISGLYKEYVKLMMIFNANILAVAFDIAFYYQGKEDFKQLVIRNLIVKSLSVAAIFIFVKNENDVPIYAIINTLSIILGNLIMWVSVFKHLVKVKPRDLKPLMHLKGTIILFLPTIAVSLYTIFDKTLIGLLIEGTVEQIDSSGNVVLVKYADLENGYYDQSEKIVKMSMVVLTTIGMVMIPRNSSEIANGNIEKVRENLFTSCSLVLLMGVPISLGLMVVSDNFIPWFFGAGFEKSILLMKIMSPIIIIIGFSNVFGLQYLVPAGKDKQFSIALILGSAINLLLNIIFIKLWWSVGAAIATIIAELTVTGVMAFMVRKEVNIFKALLSGWKYYVAGAVMFVACFFISKHLPSSILNTFIIVLTGIISYFAVLIVLKEKFVFMTIKKFLSKFRKQKNAS